MKSLVENRFGLLALVLVALAALYGVALVTRPTAAPAGRTVTAAVRVPVESVTAVCPAPKDARVSAVTAPGGAAGRATTVTPLDGGQPVVPGDPGALWQREIDEAGPLVLTGAGGLEAAQLRREVTGKARGLAGVRCATPGSGAWFIGPGPALADTTLYLANADSAPATTQLAVYSGEGPVAGGPRSGLVLKPGEHREVKLRDLAPSALAMAVEVSTEGGRIAVAAKTTPGSGKGVDWLPVSAGPATRVVVPGLPGGGGRRELYVAAPGEQDATVTLKVVAADGSYALRGRETVEVTAGSVTTLDLSTGIAGDPVALLLTADTPVLAGVMVTGPGERPDVAFAAGAEPVGTGALVAANAAPGKKAKARLVLSAPQAAARARIRVLPEKGDPPAPQEVTVPAARTVEVPLDGPAGGFGVLVEPADGSGPLYGGRVLAEKTGDGLLLTLQPLAPARLWASAPPVADSASVVLPH